MMSTQPNQQQPAIDGLVQIERMGGKPVFEVPAKSVINFNSGFSHKLLCDGLTFSAGSACQYSCTYCYVTDLMKKSPHLENVRAQYDKIETEKPFAHSEVVIRRAGVLNALRSQLTSRNKPKFTDPNDNRVLYMSPLVDVAANPTLCDETVEACTLILSLTNWQIRILSKSSFLPRIAQALDTKGLRAKERVIYGQSIGTLENDLARCFEQGTPLVSKRLESHYWLQDNGYRTFGMICPSLPYASDEAYQEFSATMCEAIRVDRCEHVWAEVMNVRGQSFIRTEQALRDAGYHEFAELLTKAHDKDFWEKYSRDTFLAHTKNVPAEKLRFLQYITSKTKPWWSQYQDRGAILLGTSAN